MSRVEAPDKFKEQLYALFAAYLEVQQPLSADNLGGARSGAELFRKALEQADMSLVQGEAHALWMQYYSALQGDIEKIARAGNIVLHGKLSRGSRSRCTSWSSVSVCAARSR